MVVTLRPFDVETDYEPIADLMNEVRTADGIERVATVSDLRMVVTPGGRYDPVHDCRVAWLDGRRIGFIRVASRRRGSTKVVHRSEVWTLPAWRRRGAGRAMLAWSEERGRAIKAAGSMGEPGDVHEMAMAPNVANAGSAAFAEALGYEPIRYFFEMHRQLDEPIPELALPAGLELRPVDEADHRRIWDANEEAFEDHWENAEATEEDFRLQFADPDTDTSLWRIAWEGDEVAGVCFNAIYAEENERLGVKVGWLDDVSVRRPWRRRGLAAALIASSLGAFRDRGMEEAALGVDAENPSGALVLYERLGFTRRHAQRLFRKPF
jgi:mycothiol synthase